MMTSVSRLAALVTLSSLGLSGCAAPDAVSRTEFEATQAALGALQARDEIRELFSTYGRTLDERDFEAFGRLFARDGEFIGGNGSAQGPENVAAMLKQSITRGSTEPTGPNLHVFSNETIDVRGESATAVSRGGFFVQSAEGRPAALIYATYRDELVREDGTWKFRRREVVSDIPGPPR